MAKNSKEEPSTAPQPDRWYNLTLGSSLKEDHPSTNKFCTLRYEFKPASIDKSQAGTLHKNKDNRVTVEFQNNQPGKQKVSFEGSSEDYKDNDAVLFFDGKTFRLERLHRAVKRLRHLRLPGESSAAHSVPALPPTTTDSRSPPLPSGKSSVKSHTPNKTSFATPPPVQVEVERIDVVESESPGAKRNGGRVVDNYTRNPSPGLLADTRSEEDQDLVIDDDTDGNGTPPANRVDLEKSEREVKIGGGFDINLPSQNDTDDEIADVDLSDDDGDKRPNAADALKAQAENEKEKASSSSSESSESGSSGSGSSSSDSEASEDDSITSI